MVQFVNSKDSLVTEAIDGILAASGGALTRLDGYPHIKVVYRSDLDKSKVALISGGGSGHEPAHIGFVGQGMLTAAVCGDVFASPSVEAVLAGILAVTGEAGCLLIVKNYTGDRLNFGLAAERARALGRNVEMVVVDDDIALPDLPQARGVAGTLFVHKIAGAAAEAGEPLAKVKEKASAVISAVRSIGMSLDTCTIPGSEKENRIKRGMAELGLGIHGEAGVEQVAFDTAKSAMVTVLDKLSGHLQPGPHIVLLNNLGSTMPLEMSVLSYELATAERSEDFKFIIGPAQLMTSLDMHGFSVSVLPAKDEWVTAMQEPVALAAWPQMRAIARVKSAALPDGLSPIRPIPSENADTRSTIEAICDLLIESERSLNELDAKSGDGDTGSTLASAARALKGAMDQMPLADLTQLFPALGNELSQTMGGSSGVILAIYFGAAGDACASGLTISEALSAGLARVSQVGGAVKGDRTMIDALDPALAALSEGIKSAALAAREGADLTAKIGTAKAGRAAYVPEENLIGYNDPGAEAIARVFEGLAREIG
ncbi:dihydroxyacetone kinase subunit DhaK [Pseudohalocynthiibacter aestuariivivens]|jgi:ATP-dependent dihydroxyacetone kinase|uniref:Dihydroxyacetone kinase subunit DhaK n=1 Tax=Pseudohalocynthiibacter aestuariivivens TaxID=1591409 RepID=A0ABV5JDA8_9RHOB|nr:MULTISPECIES: dihydroxyacetone kinase subunit DhaK [Pseudohalocynthiibacter]MBS9717055.1 dihydroxyacetone kinase subunit DhaK [Pseudohalocynthiibacter aestuariivivens]MCK0104020.1 dihydroxyacetone kinase subunit DhaK [Pseudohalocynthiibacter sp. F2068]